MTAIYINDLQLDLTSEFIDIATEGGQSFTIDDQEAIRQRLVVKLQTFKGTWFADPNFGMAWYQYVLTGKKPVNWVLVDAAFIECILTTDGIDHLNEPISYSLDESTRVVTVSFKATLITGQTIDVKVPGVLYA
jgi:hypothetical protein